MWNADYISYKGKTEFIRAFKGVELVWGLPYNGDAFWVENINDEPVIFVASEGTAIGNCMSGNEGVLFSFDKETWQDLYDIEYQGHVTIPPYSKLYLINDSDIYIDGYDGLNLFRVERYRNDYTEEVLAKFNIGGNLNKLMYNWKENVIDLKRGYACYFFFSKSLVVDASKLILPATKLADACYSGMFLDCKELLYPPKLPATELAERCYSNMFQYCVKLLEAPELPATELTRQCYFNMFYQCHSLQIAPELPATKLNWECYTNMFAYCKSMVLPPPKLPATKLTEECYTGMFRGCISLVEVPKLPAKTLAKGCYSFMFYGCTNLKTITCLAINFDNETQTIDWVDNVSKGGTFYKHPDAVWEFGDSGIPEGWEIIDYTE